MSLILRLGLGLVLGLGLIAVFFWRLDIGQMGRELRDANFAYYVPAVLVFLIADLGLRSLRWRFLLVHLKPIAVRRVVPVVTIGYMANYILPMRLGELVRAHFLGEREEISKTSVLATVAVERVFDGIVLILMAAVILPFLPWVDLVRGDSGGIRVAWLIGAFSLVLIFGGGVVALFLVARSPNSGLRLARIVSRMMPQRLRARVESFVLLIVQGLDAVRSPRILLTVSLLSVPLWLAEATVYYLLSISFSLDQPFHIILFVTIVTSLASAIPSTIGGFGPFDLVLKNTLISFGVAGETAAAYTLFVHFVALILPTSVLGAYFLWSENLSLFKLVRSKKP